MCDALTAAFGVKIKRNIGQARDGGNDIDLGPFVIECKRRKTLGTVYGWLEQAIKAVGQRPLPAHPIVIARQDQGESIVILRLTDFLPIAKDYLGTPYVVGQ